MMTLYDLLFIAVALAMDCFTVSIAGGVLLGRQQWHPIFRTAFLFGLFQAAMPLAGWFFTHWFAQQIAFIDHWIAFSLLLFLGVRMIREAFLPAEEHHFNPVRLATQLTLAVATSIDALAVGISFACTGYQTFSQLKLPLLLIGLVSFVLSIAGYLLGIRFGKATSHRLKPELVGGAILIFIGAKILVTHLLD